MLLVQLCGSMTQRHTCHMLCGVCIDAWSRAQHVCHNAELAVREPCVCEFCDWLRSGVEACSCVNCLSACSSSSSSSTPWTPVYVV